MGQHKRPNDPNKRPNPPKVRHTDSQPIALPKATIDNVRKYLWGQRAPRVPLLGTPSPQKGA